MPGTIASSLPILGAANLVASVRILSHLPTNEVFEVARTQADQAPDLHGGEPLLVDPLANGRFAACEQLRRLPYGQQLIHDQRFSCGRRPDLRTTGR